MSEARPALLARSPRLARGARASALLGALLLAPGCGPSQPAKPPPTSAQRFNGEGLRRLERGDVTGADEMFHDALREAELVDDLQGQAESWNNLGALSSARGQHREAWAYHARALRLYAARGVRDAGEVHTRTNLGGAMLLAGAVDEATAQFQQAAALAAELRDASAGAMARVGLAAVELRRGRAAAASEQARREADDAHARGDASAEAAALSIEGAALELSGKLAEARSRYEQALALDRQREQPGAVVDGLRALARLSERQGDRAAASSYLARASRITRRLGDLPQAAAELRRAIDLLGGQGDEARALQGELDALSPPRPAP